MTRCKPRSKENASAYRNATTKIQKELQSFLGIINYLSKFSLTAEVYEPLLTLVKADWAWNRMYQDLYGKVKTVVKKDVCMKFYKASRPLYLETDASGD